MAGSYSVGTTGRGVTREIHFVKFIAEHKDRRGGGSALGCRVDLPDVDRAWLPGGVVDVLRGRLAAAVGAGVA
jgi:hypothetical protein